MRGEYPSANCTCSARSLGKLANIMANKGSANGVSLMSLQAWETLHSNPTIKPHYGMEFRSSFTAGGVCLFDWTQFKEDDIAREEEYKNHTKSRREDHLRRNGLES